VEAPAPLRPPWLLGIAVGVVFAAAVVGAVAGGVHSHVGHASTIPRLSTLLGYVAVATTVTVLVAGSVLFFIMRPRRRSKDDAATDPPPGTRLERILIQLAMLALVAAPLTVVLLLLRDHAHRRVIGAQAGAGPAIPRTVEPGSTSGPRIQWSFFLALAIGALVILAFVAVSRARRAREEEDAGPEDALEPVVAAGMEALESERDPRRAVIKAYLAMERTLGEQGMPRRPSETPLEYLRRVLEELGAGAVSARRLTSLFERAKFSRHTIDERMRQDALSDLAALRAAA
jgi:heme/copper-type cytochrome/quinol oxidase subunit 2